jgi:predicted mannosyl-3-phosphoglycerate phosphatase (HAD superfamily)
MLCYSNYIATRKQEQQMTITTKTLNFLGKRMTFFQVLQGTEVVQVCETEEQAEQWIEANK